MSSVRTKSPSVGRLYKMWRYIIFISFVALSAASKTVRISQGTVRGYKDPNGGVYAFYDIPYASTPTGPHRFKAPNPAPIWLNTFDAIDRKIMCPQGIFLEKLLPPNKQIIEDCLVASVFIPDTDEKNLPVAVYIHGGAFQIGYGNMMKATNLIKTKSMVFVTFNYRLGAHGFLCLGTKDAPGNAGMKDQIALLRWVQKNIAAFGGNPNDVTIAGGSAGSAAVELLILSKAAKGLFHKAIPESGSNLAAFTVQIDPIERAKEFAKSLYFENFEDIYALEQFYKSSSFETLNKVSISFRTDYTFGFSPCVEGDTGEEVFLDDAPINILKRGDFNKVPMLCGFAEMEGLMYIAQFEIWKEKMNEKFSDFLPADLKFENEEQKEEVAQSVKKFYFGDKLVGDETILDYINLMTDLVFGYSTLKSIKLQLEAGNDQIYLYEYSFVDDETPVIPYTDNVRGATHCAQSMAVMDGKNLTHLNENDASESYRQIKTTLRKMWSNFIYSGTPVPEGSSLPSWPAVSKPWAPHMSLGQTLELRDSLIEERARFWNNIYEKHYQIPKKPVTPAFRAHDDL